MILTLVGMRGTGKTSVGRALAERLGWEFADSDAAIVKEIGKPIAEIFAEDGESRFRELEAATLADLLASSRNLVVASGGGAVLNEQTRVSMTNAGPVAWLTAPVDVMQSRVLADDASAAQRPSLTGQSIGDELAAVLRARRHLYQSVATIVVPTEAHSPDELALDIVARLASDLGIDSGRVEV